MSAIEGAARTISLDAKHPATEQAKLLLSTLSALSQLVGWTHVQAFIKDRKQISPAIGARGVPFESKSESKDDLEYRGRPVLARLLQRVDWMLDLLRRANNKPFDAETAVKIIAADREWQHEATAYLKEAESRVAEMLAHNQNAFNQFRERARKGVQWPHSAKLREEIEKAGFAYRPMMIKRDRCVCDVCGVEVSGWRPWHNPWSFHNYLRHPANFQPALRTLLQPPTSTAVSQLVTEANRRKALHLHQQQQLQAQSQPIPSSSNRSQT